MRIEFKKIEIYNFKSFENEVFEFDKLLGLNLVCGKNNDIPGSKNGSGKSSIFSALIFSLFGQTQENIKNENISNMFLNSKEIRVITYFDIKDKNYKIISGHNKYGQPYCQLLDISNENEIVDLTKSTMKDTRKFLCDEILHCDLSIFLRTILLSADQNYNFFRLKKQDKKEFIEKLFDIQIFGQMYELIHKDVLSINKQIIQIQDKLLVLYKNDDNFKTRIEKFNIENKDKILKLNNKLDELKNKKAFINNKNITVNTTEEEKYKKLLENANESLRKLNDIIYIIKNKRSDIELKIHKLLSSKESKQKTIDKHSDILKKLCNDCAIIFKNFYNISKINDSIKEIDISISQYQDQIKDINIKYDTVTDKINLCDKKILEIKNKLKDLTSEFNKTQKEILITETQISQVEKDIDKIKNSENPYEDLYQSNQIEIQQENEKLKIISEKYNYLNFSEKIVSQDTLRKFIINDLVGLLNNKIKTYLVKLGAKYNVIFDSDMNYEFITEGGVCEYDNFSSGERARIMIATCFAFRDFMYIRNNFSSNILILDEFIDGAIDSQAIENILKILKDFSTIWNQNIFVISHRKEISNDIFNNIIQVIKTNNISKITYIDN